MVDAEPWPIANIAEALRGVHKATPRRALARSQPELLRIRDIAAYIGVTKWALIWSYEAAARNYQRQLSWFFQLWEAREIVKAEIDGEWKIVRRERLAQMAPSAFKKKPYHALKVDFERGTLRWR